MKRFTEMIPDDREFELGDELWTWETPYWEDLAAIFDEDVHLIQQAAIAAAKEAEAEAKGEAGETAADAQTRDNISRVQTRIMLFLPKEDHARWRKLCARRTKPVPMFLFNEVYRWLLEVATGRPTTPPSDSEPGGGNGAVSSQAGSRSRGGGRRR